VTYLEISLPRLLVSFALIAGSILLSRRSRIGLEGQLFIGAIRAAAQLLAIGYGLLILFRHERGWSVMLVVTVMVLVAAATAARRVEHGPPARRLFLPALIAIGAGGGLALLPIFALVISPRPWFEARLVVPISGMILSNAMNVVALVFERLFSSVKNESQLVEQWLALGASPAQALAAQERAAVRASMIPAINGLLTVGLVSLPGMMTGQIVSGTEPIRAVRYQIVIMYQLATVATISSLVAAWLVRRLVFDRHERLIAAAGAATERRAGASDAARCLASLSFSSLAACARAGARSACARPILRPNRALCSPDRPRSATGPPIGPACVARSPSRISRRRTRRPRPTTGRSSCLAPKARCLVRPRGSWSASTRAASTTIAW
jgi:putative ABC transport system permease protein